LRSTTQRSTLSFTWTTIHFSNVGWNPSLLKKAPSKGGEGRRNKERGPKFKPEVQKPKWVTIGQRNKSMWHLFWERLVGYYYYYGRKKDKRMRSQGIGNLTLNLDGLPFFLWKFNARFPPIHPPSTCTPFSLLEFCQVVGVYK
jgi:hypothetical protein